MFKKDRRYSFKRGLPPRVINTNFFNLRYQKNPEGLHTGVVVGKKIDKRANVRNRIKRRFIHSLKEVFKDKDFSYDLVFFLKKQITEKRFNEIKALIEESVKGIK